MKSLLTENLAETVEVMLEETLERVSSIDVFDQRDLSSSLSTCERPLPSWVCVVAIVILSNGP